MDIRVFSTERHLYCIGLEYKGEVALGEELGNQYLLHHGFLWKHKQTTFRRSDVETR